jgi:lipase chaperone LimK
MASLLDSKFGVGLACVLCAAAAAVGVAWLRDGAPQPPSAAPVKAASWDGPLGPGALPSSSSAGGGEAFATAPGEPPLVDAAGRLAVNPALHQLFDAYLKTGAPREEALRAYLRRRLQQPALAQAEQLAGDYLRYLRAEAGLRASERVAPPDPSGMSIAQVDQMLAWQQQRSQLRERMLGTTVAQAWFGSEDADCRTALADWRIMRTPSDAEELSPGELRERRVHGAMLEERRNERAQSCAAQLMDRLAANGPAA